MSRIIGVICIIFCVGFCAMLYPAGHWLDLSGWRFFGACAGAGVGAIAVVAFILWLLFRNSHWQ